MGEAKVADVITIQDLVDGRLDIKGMATFYNGAAGEKVPRRLAPPINTLDFHLEKFTSIEEEYTQLLNDVNSATTIATNNAINLVSNVTNQATQSVQNAIEGVAVDANLVTDSLTTIVPLSVGANARTQLDKNRESVSLFDFFTKAEIVSYRQIGSSFDVSRPLQAFFNYIAANDTGTAYCSGDFKVSSALLLGGASGCLTKVVVGNLKLTALNAISTMLKLQVGTYFHWKGHVSVTGVGSVSYEARLCNIGVHIGGDYSASRCRFDSLYAARFNYIGVFCDDNTTLSDIGIVRTAHCGSGKDTRSLTTKVTGVVHTGGFNSSVQRSILNVTNPPPVAFDSYKTPTFININNEFYYIYGIDRINNTLEVFPWVKGSITATEDINYIVGGGVVLRGSNASAFNFGIIDVADSGLGFHDLAQYASNVQNLVIQFCTVGYARGANQTSVNYGGFVSSYYMEANKADILRVSTIAENTMIGSVYEFNYDRIKYCSSANRNNDSGSNTGNMSGFALQDYGYVQSFGSNIYKPGSFYNIRLGLQSHNPILLSSNATELRIPTIDISNANAFGHCYQQCIIFGTGVADSPTGAITVTAPTGMTLNGGTQTLSFSGFTGVARFDIFLDTDAMNIKVVCLSSALKLNTYAYPAKIIAPSTTLTQTIAVSGVVLGDVINVAIDKPLQGTILTAEVVSTGNINVTHYNPTASSISIAASTIKVRIN